MVSHLGESHHLQDILGMVQAMKVHWIHVLLIKNPSVYSSGDLHVMCLDSDLVDEAFQEENTLLIRIFSN